jgi:hypothetical protein
VQEDLDVVQRVDDARAALGSGPTAAQHCDDLALAESVVGRATCCGEHPELGIVVIE